VSNKIWPFEKEMCMKKGHSHISYGIEKNVNFADFICASQTVCKEK
jgi:hypothetical protein